MFFKSPPSTTSGETDPELKPIRSQVHVDDMGIQLILSNQGITVNVDHVLDSDEAMIIAMGYKPEFKREFSLLTVFAVSFSVLGLLPLIAACFDYQQAVAGISPIPWLIAVIFVTLVALLLAEVALAFPVSLGTPYAVLMLLPPKYQAVLTWLTCWSNWLCQITAAPAVNYLGACMILALYLYTDPSFTPTTGQIYGLTTGITMVHLFISLMPTKWLAQFNTMGTLCNILFLTVVFVMILAGNQRDKMYDDIPKFNSNLKAWALTNYTDYPMGIAMLCSFLGVVWSMSGYDLPFHLAEECSNAALAAPRAIVLTSSVGGLIGFVFMIAIAYTVVDMEQVIGDPAGLGQPFVTYLTQFLKRDLVLAALSLTIISSFFMGCLCMLAALRVTFAYSRDDMFPGSFIWKRVSKLTQTPINAVWINWLLGQLLLLLMFAGDVAIGAIFSVGGIAGFVSFTIPTLLKITYARDKFVPGPWNLGRWSTPIGVVLVAFVTVMIPILCFPTVAGDNLTPDTMNWTVVVYFGPLLLSLVYYYTMAHKWYVGPKSNLDSSDVVYGDTGVIDGKAGAPVKADVKIDEKSI